MRLTAIIFLFVWAVSLKAQVNLVPNPSFEEYDHCPNTNGEIELAEPWTAVYGGGGTCYFHECGTDPWGIPDNYFGWQYPRTGQAYIAYGFWAFLTGLESQFSGVPLIDPLIAGKKYHVEFYVSSSDSAWQAIKDIGVYFSQSQPPSNINTLLSYEPQVRYTGEEYLNDRINWTRIEGSFYADGGEQFMTIGNFDGHNNTDTVFVPGGGGTIVHPEGYWDVAVYYIDDVSVTLDTTTSIPETEKPKLKIFPNPASGNLTVESVVHSPQSVVEIYSAQGQMVLQSSINNQTSTIPLNLAKGVYLLRVKEKEEVVFGEKVVIDY